MEDIKTTENSVIMNNETIQNSEVPVIRKKIGNITFLVKVHFSETGKETMQDKISRMLREDVRHMGS